MRSLAAVLISVGLAASLPLAAAQKKPASATKAQFKAKAKAVAKPAPARTVQQHPSTERYTQIEQALVERGYLSEAIGAWGADSVAALKRFQQEQGLPVDGKLGALSLTALGLGPRRNGTVEEAISAGVLPSGSAPTPLD